ncbi:MAG: SMP-30/gluconolactonase/LRE family protein [Verrucomicrobia bacterium]|nr:SMP-30/gluconolactonase/LRE family protein [Verrucomicrobiota bacterium]
MRAYPLALFSITTGLCFHQLAAEEPAPPAAFSNSPVIEENAQLRVLADVFTFTEGPAADAEGNVYFTDQPNDRILVWTVDQALHTFMKPAGRSNGLYFDQEGRLVACADEKNELWRIDVKTKEKEVLVPSFDGKLLNGPNDAWIDPQGGIYFTDPYYKRGYWQRGDREQDGQHVYYLAKGAKEPVRVTDDLFQPNGIIGTPDGKALYVADIQDSKTYRFDIRSEDGILVNKRLHFALGSDGMTLDSAGNVYLTGKGVTVVSPDGAKIEQIPVPENWTANVTFGGSDRKSLFITAMDSLYVLPMKVAGASKAK